MELSKVTAGDGGNHKTLAESAATSSDDIDEFDEILEIVGSKGKYQKFLLYCIACPISAIIPFVCYNGLFMHNQLDHWCYEEDAVGLNETMLKHWKEIHLPKEIGPDGKEKFSSCKIKLNSTEIVDCPSGWDYDRSELTSTIDSDYDWVCSKSYYTATVFTVSGIGGITGALVFGILSDKYGRKPTFFAALLIYLVFNILALFTPSNFILYLALSGISAIGFQQVFLAPTLITAELCDDEFRSWSYSIGSIVWVIGMATLPYTAYLAQTWFLLGLITTLPCLLLFGYITVLPESPRWLVSAGKTKEASTILLKVATVNSVDIDKDKLDYQLERLKTLEREDGEDVGFLTLFKKRTLAKHTLLMAVSLAISTFIYDGITLNTPNIPGDQFFNFFLLAIIEIPGNWLGGFLFERHGRRWTQVLSFGLTGLSSLAAAIFILFPDWSIVVTVAILVSKFSVTITYLGISLQLTELLPTPLRGTGNSFAATMTGILSLGAPAMVYLGRLFAPMPYAVMGLMACTAMVCSIFLPETLHQHLPETVEAANNFGRDMQFWSLKPKEIPKIIKYDSIRRK